MTTSSTNGTLNGRAPPFGQWERSVAARYLRAKRSQGGVALISIISFVGIMLAVAVLIIVMSVMNGFRAELLSRMLGFSGHLYVTGGVLTDPDREAVIKRISDLPGVVQVEMTGDNAVYTRVYLHNALKGKWQFLNSYKDHVLEADTAGEYLLTTQNLRFAHVDMTFFIAGLVVIVGIIIAYIVIKKRYWFW